MLRGLTNSYLEKTAKKFLDKKFLGVYPCNVHPKTKRRTFSIIFNTGKSDTEGEHFIAVNFTLKSIFYFDPFGEPLLNKDIILFIENNKKKRSLSVNTFKMQDDNSNFCGFYCLAYLISIKRKMPYKKFINLFSIQNKKNNDKIVINFIIGRRNK